MGEGDQFICLYISSIIIIQHCDCLSILIWFRNNIIVSHKILSYNTYTCNLKTHIISSRSFIMLVYIIIIIWFVLFIKFKIQMDFDVRYFNINLIRLDIYLKGRWLVTFSRFDDWF